ncbi:MAG: hypothetical protein VW378_04545 [bacterium]
MNGVSKKLDISKVPLMGPHLNASSEQAKVFISRQKVEANDGYTG